MYVIHTHTINWISPSYSFIKYIPRIVGITPSDFDPSWLLPSGNLTVCSRESSWNYGTKWAMASSSLCEITRG